MRIYLPDKVIFTELCSKTSVNITFSDRLIFMSTKIEVLYYTIIDLCFGRHGVLLNSKRQYD